MARKTGYCWVWLIVLLLATGCAKPVMFEQTGVELDANNDDYLDDAFKVDVDNIGDGGAVLSAPALAVLKSASYAAMRGLLDLEAGTDFYSVSAMDTLLNAKQNASTAATDAELALKQDASTAATDTELALKQDASTAATDSELALKQDASTAATDIELSGHTSDADIHNGTCDPTAGDCGAEVTCNTIAVVLWAAPTSASEIRCLESGGVNTYYYWTGVAWTEFGGTSSSTSFAFDTYPTNENSPYSSGIAVNATTLAIYSAGAGKWLTAALTDTLAAGFAAWDTFTRTDSNLLGALDDGTYSWVEAFGDLDIETNRIGLGTAGTAAAIIGATAATGYVQSSVNLEGSAYSQPGLIFWYADVNNYWYACIDNDDGAGDDIELHQVASGTDTELNDAAFYSDIYTTYTLKVTFNATDVVVRVGSTDYITHSGSFGAETGDVGITQYRGGGATGWNDDFIAGE